MVLLYAVEVCLKSTSTARRDVILVAVERCLPRLLNTLLKKAYWY